MTELAVWTDDVDDIELGCVVYSKTHVRAGDWSRGGVVIRLELDGEDDAVLSVTVLEWNGVGRQQYPTTFDIPRVDIAEPGDQFFSADARKAADAIARWLGGPYSPKDFSKKARWYAVVGELAERATGLYLPKAETRFQRAQAAKRAAS